MSIDRRTETGLASVGGIELVQQSASGHSRVHAVPIEALRQSDSPRLEGENSRHIEYLAQAETALPPILVHRPTMRVIDGMHRLRAAKLRGQRTIQVRFFDGDENNAFVEAVRANRSHGLPLTFADREAAAARILASQPQMSDRAIADVTGLAPRTVAAIRHRTRDSAGDQMARIGRDGRVRPLNSASGRRLASEIISERPGASLRQIAQGAGISLATARDVRERMRRGDDPLPSRLRRDEERTTTSEGDRLEPDSRVERRRDTPRDHKALLQNLSRDPSLRLSESGRAMLRWLFARSAGPDGWDEVMAELPPHCVYVVVEVARGCGEEWLEFANQLEKWIGSTA